MTAPQAADRFRPGSAATPPEAPLAMPAQDLRRRARVRFRRPSLRVLAARITAFGGAALLSGFAAEQMLRVFAPGTIGTLQWLLLGLFVPTFLWIAFSATTALAGLLFSPRAPRPAGDAPLRTLTAIVMPVYHEDAAGSFGALAALGRGLHALGHGAAFEIFVLSDSRDADAWVRETTAFAALRRALDGAMPAWYRRRERNIGRKAGNVEEFVHRWGARYDFMLPLDADSVMAPEVVVEMVRRMEAAPDLALLQTVPALAGGETPFARLQQFAGAVHGPVVARGVAAWQGEDGNYWGHNALIRVRAFADCAGLPELRGRPPFGGRILSHDFVEAALLRRAGWAVRMDPDLRGSWEGAPPSLLAAAARDRRWAQGNFQHLGVIGARGLRWPNRAHFAIGIASYLMSPLWLAFLLVGFVITGQAALFRPEYFAEGYQLFPNWPRFDSVRMGWLLVLSFGLLLWPKLLGLAMALASRSRRRAFGGGLRLVAGSVVELVASALVAPALMLLQSRHVASILAGSDTGWAPQERRGAVLPWRTALAAHGGHAVVGVLAAVAIAVLQPELLVWTAPVLVGLIAEPALSRASGAPRLGAALARAGLLDVPEDRALPAPLREGQHWAQRIAGEAARGLADLLSDARLRAEHIAGLGPVRERPLDGPEGLARVTARAKIAVARDRETALRALDSGERVALAERPRLLVTLARKRSTANAPAPLGAGV